MHFKFLLLLALSLIFETNGFSEEPSQLLAKASQRILSSLYQSCEVLERVAASSDPRICGTTPELCFMVPGLQERHPMPYPNLKRVSSGEACPDARIPLWPGYVNDGRRTPSVKNGELRFKQGLSDCSSLVGAALRVAGLRLVAGNSPDGISTGTIYNSLGKSSSCFEVVSYNGIPSEAMQEGDLLLDPPSAGVFGHVGIISKIKNQEDPLGLLNVSNEEDCDDFDATSHEVLYFHNLDRGPEQELLGKYGIREHICRQHVALKYGKSVKNKSSVGQLLLRLKRPLSKACRAESLRVAGEQCVKSCFTSEETSK